MEAAKIAIENAALPFDKEYSYSIPSHLEGTVQPGCRVQVPFGRGNQKRTGIVLSLEEASEGRLKEIAACLDSQPVLGEEGLLLLRYLKSCTFCTWFDALRLLIPAGLGISYQTLYMPVKREPQLGLPADQARIMGYLIDQKKPVEQGALCDALEITPKDQSLCALLQQGLVQKTERHRQKIQDEKISMVRLREEWAPCPLTPKQKQVRDFLEENETASLKEVCYYNMVTRVVVDGLVKKGAAEYYEAVQLRNPYEQAESAQVQAAPALSPKQRLVCESLIETTRQAKPLPALLYGVTGSGKTQVFLALIDHVLSCGRQVIVMVPEISLTSQTVGGLHARFGNRVAVLHSGLSLGERMDEWRRIKSGGADIVVGTRSAVFAPLRNVGLIVMDEEQESAYKSEKSPRFHAREVAKVRCDYHGALLLLASATPSLESYYLATQGKYSLFTLEDRFGPARLPDVYMVDMKEGENLSATPSLSNLLLEELRYNLDHGEQSILLLNRRGYSTVVKCSACGTVADCPHCSVALTYHTANQSLMCHYCGYLQPKIGECAHCHSDLVRYSGAGTQKLEEDLAALFPGARVVRVDMDTTMAKFSHERLFGAFSRGEYDIMIGTQMVAKGLNFPKVTLVGVLCADQSLYGGDFRSFERSFSLLTQVVGRSGRGEARGRAIIQTYTPENPVIQLAAEQDYTGFYQQEIFSRKIHLYPPYCSMAGVGFVGEDLSQVRGSAMAYLKEFKERARRDYPGLPIRLLGPAPFDVLKAAEKYRYKLVVKCRNDRATRALLGQMMEWFYSKFKQVSIFTDMFYDHI